MALLPYQKIFEMQSIRSTVSKFPMEVVSEDEREVVDGKEYYLLVKPDWRSSDGENLCGILDALHMASHFTADDRPRPGRFAHPRTAFHRLYKGPAPSGLPSNLYKSEYLESLTSDELDDLNVQPKVDLLFPARIMRFVCYVFFEYHLTLWWQDCSSLPPYPMPGNCASSTERPQSQRLCWWWDVFCFYRMILSLYLLNLAGWICCSLI